MRTQICMGVVVMVDKVRTDRLENLQRNNAKIISNLQNTYGANLEGVSQMQVSFFIDWLVEVNMITPDQVVDFNINWEIHLRSKMEEAISIFDDAKTKLEQDNADELARAASQAPKSESRSRLIVPNGAGGKIIRP